MFRKISKVIVLFVAVVFLFGGTAIGEEKFGGIGLSVGTNEGELVVLDVLAGTDAQAKGVLQGDIITKIDGVSTNGVNFDALVGKLRGRVGSEVVLEVKRTGAQKAITFKINRTEIVHKG